VAKKGEEKTEKKEDTNGKKKGKKIDNREKLIEEQESKQGETVGYHQETAAVVLEVTVIEWKY